MKLNLLSIYILNSKTKIIFINILIYLILLLILNYFDTSAYNMGNCIKTPAASPEMLDSQYYLTYHGMLSENRALNTIINDLRQEIADLNNQIRLNNQLNIDHTQMIQQLTTEQRETKEIVVELKHKISQFEVESKKTIMQNPFYGCIK